MSQGRAVLPDHGAGSGAITASRHLFSAVCSPRYAGSAHARPGRPICPWSSSRCWQGFQYRLDHYPAHAPVVRTLGTDVQGAQAITRPHRVPGQRIRAKPGTRGCGQLPKPCPSGHTRGLDTWRCFYTNLPALPVGGDALNLPDHPRYLLSTADLTSPGFLICTISAHTVVIATICVSSTSS